ncbi:rod shape-determining protein MreC [Blochmannia endosymbiont of Colobopsis nipponica]|uniref:rod shape-determining protein MreC n=1 Tax=Blochmannia endosymbiont of Colobopsis nipponica TaxID=2681987 RepID=UPI00177C9850|nr:rod shape-determining protein MreC [Blochmannia endosymbiont of Colobopsis nipponica]QOI11147.1 rod shape-determining protein MreC [Blochmannia endosymbiont of Colobopsis nipponica]
MFNRKLKFNKSNILQIKFFFMLMLAAFLMIADFKLNVFIKMRNYGDMTISTLYFAKYHLLQIFKKAVIFIKEKQQLALENHILRTNLLLKNSDLLLMENYKQENKRLHELLASPLCHKQTCKMVTKVIGVNVDPHRNQIIIDKGIKDNVYIGQPIINDKGIIGQVISINKISSKVMLICDTSHAIPIKIMRNNIRLIAVGNGLNKDLKLEFFPGYVDIQIGDLLVTSGLGGHFPEGYPVAKVTLIKKDKRGLFTIAQARPLSKLQHLSDLILIWHDAN